MEYEISSIGQFGFGRANIKRIHIITKGWKWTSLCSTYMHSTNITNISWKNICPKCKTKYGKNLKQDLILFKLKGNK